MSPRTWRCRAQRPPLRSRSPAQHPAQCPSELTRTLNYSCSVGCTIFQLPPASGLGARSFPQHRGPTLHVGAGPRPWTGLPFSGASEAATPRGCVTGAAAGPHEMHASPWQGLSQPLCERTFGSTEVQPPPSRHKSPLEGAHSGAPEAAVGGEGKAAALCTINNSSPDDFSHRRKTSQFHVLRARLLAFAFPEALLHAELPTAHPVSTAARPAQSHAGPRAPA